jgi:hypothetical protein
MSLAFAVIVWMMSPEVTDIPSGHEAIRKALAELGPADSALSKRRPPPQREPPQLTGSLPDESTSR